MVIQGDKLRSFLKGHRQKWEVLQTERDTALDLQLALLGKSLAPEEGFNREGRELSSAESIQVLEDGAILARPVVTLEISLENVPKIHVLCFKDKKKT